MKETLEVELETGDLEQTVRELITVLDPQAVVDWEINKKTGEDSAETLNTGAKPMDSIRQPRVRKLEERLKDKQQAINDALEVLGDSSKSRHGRIIAAQALLEPHSHGVNDGGQCTHD